MMCCTGYVMFFYTQMSMVINFFVGADVENVKFLLYIASIAFLVPLSMI